MTLIEVMAALALLGSLAVAMVLSRGRLVEQHRMAEQKLDAVEAAEELLAQWWSEETKQFPIDASGEMERHPGWVWETKAIPDRSLEQYDAQIVRLTLQDTSQAGRPVELTSVDLVLPRQAEARLP